jgi:two-component system, NtrC family, response regulator PilR
MFTVPDNFKILLVDDNVELVEILQEYLKTECDLIEGALTGQEALTKYEAGGHELVITDLNMPGMTGLDLVKAMKALQFRTEFVIITGYASLDSAIEAVKLGAFDYIVKPFKMEELGVVVKNAREKVHLARTNEMLEAKLDRVYREMERYVSSGTAERSEPVSATERIVEEANRIKKYERNRFFIE